VAISEPLMQIGIR